MENDTFNVENDTTVDCENFSMEMATILDPFRSAPSVRQVIITLYSIVAIIGAAGNLLVIAAVTRCPQMRTPRFYFIINLAVSDFLMCTITVPFTMKSILDHLWEFGLVMCKFISSLQAINIFVSTMSITAIALDRFLLIIFPMNIRLQRLALSVCFFSVWGISVALAMPMLYFSTILRPFANMTGPIFDCGYTGLEMCREDISETLKQIYSVGVFLFQYCFPLFTLLFAYSKVILQMRNRIRFRKKSSAAFGGEIPERLQEEIKRQRMANLLITLLVLIFAIVWLPLNIYNTIIVNYFPSGTSALNFAICHVIGMLSACANPILYGILNHNFKREFVKILRIRKIQAIHYRLTAHRKTTLTTNRFVGNGNVPQMNAAVNAMRQSYGKAHLRNESKGSPNMNCSDKTFVSELPRNSDDVKTHEVCVEINSSKHDVDTEWAFPEEKQPLKDQKEDAAERTTSL